MPTFDTGLISRIQQANDIVDVVGEHLALKRKGREMVGLCPFHDDHQPSFNVNPSKQIFKCFACGAGGDVVKFVQMREHLSFPQALQRLADRAGIKIEPLRPRSTHDAERTTQDETDPNELARVNAWAAKYFSSNLTHPEKGKDARKYIVERQLSEESVKKWQIGLAIGADNDLLAAARRAKIPDKLLLAAGLVAGSGVSLSDKFVNRLMFTIADATNKIIGFGGRTLTGEGAKYINSPTTVLFDKSNALFGLNHAHHQIVSTDTAVVVEGYTDCIMAHQFGVANVVATLGTSFTAGHARLLRRYAKKVVLLFDSDTAGLEAANRALQVALGWRIDIAITSVPQGKDPCEFLLAAGREPFEKIIADAPDVFKFKWERLTSNLGTQSTIAGKKQAIDDYLEAIATGFNAGNLSAIEKGLILNELSRIMNLDAREINKELNRRISRAKTLSSYSGKADELPASLDLGEGLSANSQREIIETLLAEPKLFKNVKNEISQQNFDVPVLNRVAQTLFKVLAERPEATVSEICGCIEETQIANLVTMLEEEGIKKGNFFKRLTDAIKTLKLEQQKKSSAAVNKTDEREYIRQICETAPKQDQRNMGMV
ncbi:MAG: DNA primase [Sedimentisphaerales bacterium]|nr:DNA primase [Sedimentisphaerales bacterium]